MTSNPNIPLKEAAAILADMTQNSGIPIRPDEMKNPFGFMLYGFISIGDSPIYGTKERNRWMVPDNSIRSAAIRLLESVTAPEWRNVHPLGEGHAWTSWRGNLLFAYRDNAKRAGRAVTPLSRVYGCIDALDLIREGVGDLEIPNSYANLFDRLTEVERRGQESISVCQGCGAMATEANGHDWPGYWWRVPSRNGWSTLCPSCRTAGTRTYSGEMGGVLYSNARRRKDTPADSYACRVCAKERAAFWDHCHNHGFIRGPLCPSCNGRERYWTETMAGVRHLQTCPTCQAA